MPYRIWGNLLEHITIIRFKWLDPMPTPSLISHSQAAQPQQITIRFLISTATLDCSTRTYTISAKTGSLHPWPMIQPFALSNHHPINTIATTVRVLESLRRAVRAPAVAVKAVHQLGTLTETLMGRRR